MTTPEISRVETEYGVVILNLRNGKYYLLNDVSATILEMYRSGEQRRAELANLLVHRYSLSADLARNDVDRTLKMLRQAELT